MAEEKKEFLNMYLLAYYCHRLNIRTATWAKDSHGLFDYESQRMICKNFGITTSGFIVRGGNDIKFVLKEALANFENNTDTSVLARIAFSNSSIDELCNINSYNDSTSAELWQLIRDSQCNSCNTNSYRLSKGDIIKLGRVTFKVHHYQNNDEINTSNETVAFNDAPK